MDDNSITTKTIIKSLLNHDSKLHGFFISLTLDKDSQFILGV